MTGEQEVENKMGEYSNLVVKCDLMSGMEKLAGFHEQWGRPMMLAGDTKVGDILGGGKPTALLIPAGTLNREKADMKRKAEELGSQMKSARRSPLRNFMSVRGLLQPATGIFLLLICGISLQIYV